MHFVGPCFIYCAPILGSFIAAKQDDVKHSLKDVVVFLLGRFCAYLFLGVLAGISGAYIKLFSSKIVIYYADKVTGWLLVFLGIYTFFHKSSSCIFCGFARKKIPGSIGLFLLGITIGIIPCGPLGGILFQVVLMSHSWMDGFLYLLFFGLGITLSGVIIFGILAGFLSAFPKKIFSNSKMISIFRLICALLLVLMGLKFLV